jgi:TfoX/Sxy family transcriptional regulator of competence genes
MLTRNWQQLKVKADTDAKAKLEADAKAKLAADAKQKPMLMPKLTLKPKAKADADDAANQNIG